MAIGGKRRWDWDGDRDAGVGQVGSSSNDDSRLPMATLRLPLLAFG